MADSRIVSEVKPVLRAGNLHAALLALHRGEAMGLNTGQEVDPMELRLGLFLDDLGRHRIGALYVGQLVPALADPTSDPEIVRRALYGIFEALSENPAPQREASTLLACFGEDQLAAFLRVSGSSVQRYARGERKAKGVIVDRLHWLALVVGYLTGTYNEYGVRRWFQRPRKVLDGRSPKAVLLEDEEWTPESEGARRVYELAKATVGMVAT